MAITWDAVGDRRYETGIDHGVLYPQDGSPPVPWNGLVAVAEAPNLAVTAKWIDGVKYLEYSRAGGYSAKVKGLTYPDALERLTGASERVSGVYLHDQQQLPFHFSYRTLEGDAVNGISSYELHIIYNCLATPGEHSYETIGAGFNAQTFDFDISSTPLQIEGVRPISHLSFDSRRIDPELLGDIQGAMYDGVSSDPLAALGGSVAFIDSVVATP